ncbi:protein phosphatase methylesterase [Auriculariales sp. MPI-PUGE-AT-0066]|nr:protein phosphatase methylesterase [Auriculariales sp. MPI-PUGE-AT-0066]
MSSLARSAMSARLAKLPPMPPGSEDAEGDESDGLGALPSSSSTRGAAARSRPSPAPGKFDITAGVPRDEKALGNPFYSPISAQGFFEQAVQVDVAAAGLDLRAYYTPPKLSSSDAKGTVCVCHHGAGFSGLSFAHLARQLTQQTSGELGVLAFDARGHGKTAYKELPEPRALDLSLARLSSDLVEILSTLFPDPRQSPNFVFVGHSMGGAVVVDACPVLLAKGFKIVGAVVVDVVEGSAMDALPHMHALLASRPRDFASVEEGIEWHLTTHTMSNVDSARVSIPSTLLAPAEEGGHWKWRTPLASTAPFWEGWFTDLSSKFLATRAARLLVLAGTDRLDKPLMIGQLQGKFQLVIVPGVGHLVHEDDPGRTAEILIEFWRRNDRVVPGVKKVGEE